MSFRAAIRHANHIFGVIALIAIGALSAITAAVVFDDSDDRIRSATESLAMYGATLEAERPVRAALGEVVPGDALDDYTWRCGHRHPGRLPTSREKLGDLTAEQRAALDTPIERALVDRFVRAQFREDVGSGTIEITCVMDIFRRSKVVLASALIAAERGDSEIAWRRAIALVRHGDDMLGRSSIISAMLAYSAAASAVTLLADLAGQASPEQARRWRTEIARLRASALDPSSLDLAIAVGEGKAISEWEVVDGDLRDEVLEALDVYLGTARGDESDISVWCEKVGDSGSRSAICDMRSGLESSVTAVATELEVIECKLGADRDRSCAATASRL